MKKYGIIYCGFNTEEYVLQSIKPFLNKDNYFVSAVSVPFEEYRDIDKLEDNTTGILKELVEPNLRPKLPGWDNVLLPIANRAKAYLDSNCAHCHNAEGSAKNSGLYLSYNQNDSRKRGIFKPPIAAGKGSGDFIYDIVPGHPDQSILIYRMKSNDPSIRMPEIGRSIEHSEAVVLLEQYIEELAQNN